LNAKIFKCIFGFIQLKYYQKMKNSQNNLAITAPARNNGALGRHTTLRLGVVDGDDAAVVSMGLGYFLSLWTEACKIARKG